MPGTLLRISACPTEDERARFSTSVFHSHWTFSYNDTKVHDKSDFSRLTILAIKIRTALNCHNLLDFYRTGMIFFLKFASSINIKWDQAGSCIFIRLEMRAEWRKHLLFANVPGKSFLVYGMWCTGALCLLYCKIDELSSSRNGRIMPDLNPIKNEKIQTQNMQKYRKMSFTGWL